MNLRLIPAVLLVLATASLASGCREPASRASATSATVSRDDGRLAASPGPSLYPLSLALRDQNDARVGVDVFRGNPVIVSMFYGTCPTACPMLVSHIKRLEASLPPDVRARTRVLLVSFDPAHDTPTTMRELANAHRVDVSRWRLAAGPDEDVRQLANALGVTYHDDGDGMFSHNAVVAVLDAEGRIVARTEEPSREMTLLAAAVSRVEASPER